MRTQSRRFTPLMLFLFAYVTGASAANGQVSIGDSSFYLKHDFSVKKPTGAISVRGGVFAHAYAWERYPYNMADNLPEPIREEFDVSPGIASQPTSFDGLATDRLFFNKTTHEYHIKNGNGPANWYFINPVDPATGLAITAEATVAATAQSVFSSSAYARASLNVDPFASGQFITGSMLEEGNAHTRITDFRPGQAEARGTGVSTFGIKGDRSFANGTIIWRPTIFGTALSSVVASSISTTLKDPIIFLAFDPNIIDDPATAYDERYLVDVLLDADLRTQGGTPASLMPLASDPAMLAFDASGSDGSTLFFDLPSIYAAQRGKLTISTADGLVTGVAADGFFAGAGWLPTIGSIAQFNMPVSALQVDYDADSFYQGSDGTTFELAIGTGNVEMVPEGSSMALLLPGLALFAFKLRRPATRK